MRTNQVSLTLNARLLIDGDFMRRIFMIKNRSAAGLIFIAFGNPCPAVDAWILSAGETFTLDPAAPHEAIYVWSDTVNCENSILIG